MAYYDTRTGKRVPPPKGGFAFYITLMGICLVAVDNSRWAGICLLSLYWGCKILFTIAGQTNRENHVNNHVHDTVAPAVAKEAAKPKRDTLDTALDIQRIMDTENCSLRMIEQQKQEEKALSALSTYLKQFPVKTQLEFIDYLKQCLEGKRQDIIQEILREYGTV